MKANNTTNLNMPECINQIASLASQFNFTLKFLKYWNSTPIRSWSLDFRHTAKNSSSKKQRSTGWTSWVIKVYRHVWHIGGCFGAIHSELTIVDRHEFKFAKQIQIKIVQAETSWDDNKIRKMRNKTTNSLQNHTHIHKIVIKWQTKCYQV